MTGTPRWLQQPELKSLLNRLVDRLDKADGRPVRAIKLDRKSFPALFDAAFEADKEAYWSYLLQMQAWGWLSIKTDKPQPGKADYERRPRLEIKDEQALRRAIGRTQAVKPYAQQWREAVFSNLQANTSIRQRVAEQKLEIDGRSAEEVVERLNHMPSLADEPLFLREVSARLFWGLSKILDKRKALVAALLDLDDCPFAESPVQLQVCLPAKPFRGMLFIENLTTFEQASRNSDERFAGLALVYASGFKGSARRLRTASGVSVYFASYGNLDLHECRRFCGRLLDVAESLPVWFWGDLDYAGMEILRSLKMSFAAIDAWQPGYQPMLESLLAGNGHQAHEANKLGQKPVSFTGSRYADQVLIPALRSSGRFLDQEY